MDPKYSTIRRATLADADEVAEIYLMSRKAFLPYAPLAHTDDAVRNWIRTQLIPSGGVTVAEAGDSSSPLLGMMATSCEAGTGWIDQLYLRPSIVGHGLGGRFVEHAKLNLNSPIQLYTFQRNDRAIRFYESHGFRALEYGDGSNNEEHCPDVLYEWR